MTNPNATLIQAAQSALSAYKAGPTTTDEERATWTRDDREFYREQSRNHTIRTARPLAESLDALLEALAKQTTDATAEARRRYDGDTIIDEISGEPTSHDDWGYAECQRQAFVAGAAWACA